MPLILVNCSKICPPSRSVLSSSKRSFHVSPSANGDYYLRLSNSSELLLRLRWVAILYGHIKSDMAVTGGVHTATDVVKCMMAGATVAMMTSSLLKHGIDYIKIVEKDLIEWMDDHEYESIEMMQGSMSQQSVAEPAAFERANYMRVLSSYTDRQK